MSANVAKKLLSAMAQVGTIKKSGFNKFHKYNYVTEGDVLASVREACIAAGLVVIPSVESTEYKEEQTQRGNLQTRAFVSMRYTIMDAETGETIEMSWAGESADTDDKGTTKAIVSAGKYAMLKLFMIDTADLDPDSESPRSQAAAEGPTQSLPKPVNSKKMSKEMQEVQEFLRDTLQLPTGTIMQIKEACGKEWPGIILRAKESGVSTPADLSEYIGEASATDE